MFATKEVGEGGGGDAMCLMVRSNFAKKVGGWVGISERPLPFPTPMRYGKKTQNFLKLCAGLKVTNQNCINSH